MKVERLVFDVWVFNILIFDTSPSNFLLFDISISNISIFNILAFDYLILDILTSYVSDILIPYILTSTSLIFYIAINIFILGTLLFDTLIPEVFILPIQFNFPRFN